MHPARWTLGTALLVWALAAVGLPADEKDQAHHHPRPEKLGTISFPTSCAPAVQPAFARAVALLHSFWYDEAEKAFNEVAAADPSCAMAHWGTAMSLYHPIWAPPTPAERQRGQQAVAKARAASAPTERERDYIGAIEAFFRDADTTDHRSRAVAYEKAMQGVHERHPDDREAAIFYSLALLGTAPPADKTYANQKKAGQILNRVLPAQPDHPGVAHYLIHSFDYPQLADLALAAARSYSKIAESSPHALHMPSHIFVRLGLWDDSIRANQDSAAAARAHVQKTLPGAHSFDELHAVDYLAYAYLQQGKIDRAREMVEKVRTVERLDNPNFAAAYALAAVPARYALERGRWAEAAALEVAPASFPWATFPYAEAITHYARAVGAARNGDAARARQAIERLAALHKAAVDAKIAYWPDQIEIQRRAAAGWLARAEGRGDDALRLLKEAGELEAASEKHPVTPGPVLPARELYADLLLEMGRPAEALAEYEASLATAPNRLYALAGARRAARAAGKGEKVAEGDVDVMVERLARVGRAYAPTFSPDGRYVALIADLSGMPQVWIVPAAGGWPRAVTVGNDPVGGVAWSPTSDWLAVTVLPGGGLNAQVYVVRPDGSGLRRLTDGGKENNGFGDWTPDGRFLTVTSNRRRAATMDAYLLDPVSGALDMVAELEGVGGIQSVSRDGRRAIVGRLRNRGDNNLYLLDLKTRKETLLTPHDPPGQFFGQISPDGTTVYLSSNKDRDLAAFARVRLGPDGAPGPIEVIAERPDAELDGFRLSHSGDEATLAWNVAGRNEISFVDLRSGQARPGPALPAELLAGATYSRDDRLLAVTTFGSAAPLDVWLLDRATGTFRQLTTSSHAGVDPARLVKPELVRFRAHDGLELSGWLYRPPGVSGPAPYVLSFHGGPEGQERPSFRNDYQALLAQGIGVFAPNVRGSSGFGKKFVNLDNGELRFAGVRDIKSSADFLLAQGIADPARLGITGGSYGGYMTMAGVTEYPELFAAGVNLFGIVNFATFFAQSEPWMAAISTVEYGDPATQADLLARLSPIHKLDRIKAALMVQHGANDTNVPVVEAEQIVQSLKARGVPVEYVLFPDEGHGWRKVPNRVRSITEMVEFFRKHLGGADAPATAASR
jgi:dipeptidyl aminopeptidase/acylaminoacyl peptidase